MKQDSYNARVERWTVKEMQLNRLHEEVIARRESLLRSAGGYFKQQSPVTPVTTKVLPDVSQRNSQLLKEVEEARKRLAEKFREPPGTRFLTLQSNYKAMIRSMQPMWEQAVEDAVTM